MSSVFQADRVGLGEEGVADLSVPGRGQGVGRLVRRRPRIGRRSGQLGVADRERLDLLTRHPGYPAEQLQSGRGQLDGPRELVQLGGRHRVAAEQLVVRGQPVQRERLA